MKQQKLLKWGFPTRIFSKKEFEKSELKKTYPKMTYKRYSAEARLRLPRSPNFFFSKRNQEKINRWIRETQKYKKSRHF